MRFVAVVCAAAVAACGTSVDPDIARSQQMCRRLADRLEVRLGLHAPDLPTLRSWSASDAAERLAHELSPRLNDAVATYETMLTIAGPCAKVMVVDACSQMVAPWFLDHADEGFARMRALLDGMRGRGPCALDRDAERKRPCDWLATNLENQATFLDLVQRGWRTTGDEHQPATLDATFAATKMAQWRALIDYGVAAAPVCAERAARSCEQLRDGVADAAPVELVARLDALAAAYRKGTRCPQAGAATPAAAP